jgi:hypothetical protein
MSASSGTKRSILLFAALILLVSAVPAFAVIPTHVSVRFARVVRRGWVSQSRRCPSTHRTGCPGSTGVRQLAILPKGSPSTRTAAVVGWAQRQDHSIPKSQFKEQ